jgi:hypothetical protein
MTGVSAGVAAVIATAEREFSSFEFVYLGKAGGFYAWDVSDPIGPQKVTYGEQSRAFTCDCALFRAGGVEGTCVHIEALRLHRQAQEARRKQAAPVQPAPAPPPPAQPGDPNARLLAMLLAQVERLAVAQERTAVALEQVCSYMAPKAPNYKHTLAEWRAFDWASIGAEVVRSDADGVAVVRWGGYLWTRRAPDNKFAEAVWYNRTEGLKPDGGPNYVRLVTFQKAPEPEPVGRKAQRAAGEG